MQGIFMSVFFWYKKAIFHFVVCPKSAASITERFPSTAAFTMERIIPLIFFKPRSLIFRIFRAICIYHFSRNLHLHPLRFCVRIEPKNTKFESRTVPNRTQIFGLFSTITKAIFATECVIFLHCYCPQFFYRPAFNELIPYFKTFLWY